MIRKIVSMGVLGSLLTTSLLAVTGGDELANLDMAALVRALGGRGFLDDLDDLDDFGGFNMTESTHQEYPWGNNQPEFMNFFAMREALQRANIFDLRTAGVNDLIARLEETLETVNGYTYVRMDVVYAWASEAPAWRGPLMCVLRSRWNVNVEYPWAILKLEWGPAKAAIEALVRQCHMLNQ